VSPCLLLLTATSKQHWYQAQAQRHLMLECCCPIIEGLAMNETAVLEQRRQARAEKHQVDNALLDLHLKAADALGDLKESANVRAQALQQVEKWESGHLCNPRYVVAWRNILNLPEPSMRKAMLSDDSEGTALRQNTPCGLLLGTLAK
jgi:hypothetical protein